jgi:hypothetical protein
VHHGEGEGRKAAISLLSEPELIHPQPTARCTSDGNAPQLLSVRRLSGGSAGSHAWDGLWVASLEEFSGGWPVRW